MSSGQSSGFSSASSPAHDAHLFRRGQRDRPRPRCRPRAAEAPGSGRWNVDRRPGAAEDLSIPGAGGRRRPVGRRRGPTIWSRLAARRSRMWPTRRTRNSVLPVPGPATTTGRPSGSATQASQTQGVDPDLAASHESIVGVRRQVGRVAITRRDRRRCQGRQIGHRVEERTRLKFTGSSTGCGASVHVRSTYALATDRKSPTPTSGLG